MSMRVSLYVLAVAASVLSGCGPLIQDDSWAPPRPLEANTPPYRPAQTPPGNGYQRDTVEEPEGVLTLSKALATALMGSPGLASFAWSVRIAEAQQLQKAQRPNPEIEATLEDFGGTGEASGTGSSETTVMLSQLVELGDKRRKRIALAAAERKLAGWDYEAARVSVLTEVAARFIDVLTLQEKVRLAREGLDLARQAQAAVSKRVQAGKGRVVESTRADVAVELSDIELKRTTRMLVAARCALAATWGADTPRFERVSGDLKDVRALPPLAELTKLLAQGPDMARWDQELARHRAAVDLAKAGAVPDLTVGAGYKYLAGSNDQAAVVTLGIPLPVFDKNTGEINKARFAVIKAHHDRDAVAVRANTALTRAYQGLAAAYEEATALRDVVLPGVRASFDTSLKLFQQGTTTYLGVLEAQQTLAEARGQYLDALGAYPRGVAQIEGMIGQRLSPVPSSTEAKPPSAKTKP